MDEEYAQKTKFKHRIMYGMHVAIVSSTLVGMYLPGKRSICLRQDLTFKKPIFIGDTVIVSGKVTAKSLATGIVEILVKVTKNKELVVEGTMTTQILK